MSKSQVVKASKAFVLKKQENCIVLTLSEDNTSLEGCGDEAWVRAMENNPGLFGELKEVLVAAALDVEPDTRLMHETFPKKFPRLFACPGSKQWKGIKIRSQLSKYLELCGFGHNKPKRNGEQEPPVGWTILVEWGSFKGPSKGCSLNLCTEIIKQLLEAQDLDPMDHFRKEGDHGDHEEEELDIDAEESPDDVEPQPGPSKKRKVGSQPTTSKTVVDAIARAQQEEDGNNLALVERRRNMDNIKAGLGLIVEEGEITDSD